MTHSNKYTDATWQKPSLFDIFPITLCICARAGLRGQKKKIFVLTWKKKIKTTFQKTVLGFGISVCYGKNKVHFSAQLVCLMPLG